MKMMHEPASPSSYSQAHQCAQRGLEPNAASLPISVQADMAREDARDALYMEGVDDPHGLLAVARAHAAMAARTAVHASHAIDLLTAASTQIANGEYDPTIQRRVHDAFEAYERSVAFCNPRRTHPGTALNEPNSTPAQRRSALRGATLGAAHVLHP